MISERYEKQQLFSDKGIDWLYISKRYIIHALLLRKGDLLLNHLYKLFILGELMDHAMYGYRLCSILNKVIGPLRKISWGVLYPLIHGMEESALIEQEPDQEREKNPGRKKKLYRITDEGRKIFHQLMEEPIPYKPEYVLCFQVKMANFDQIDVPLRLAILRHYRDYLQLVARHIDATTEDIREGYRQGHIPAAEKDYLLRMNMHRIEKAHSDTLWLDQMIQMTEREDN